MFILSKYDTKGQFYSHNVMWANLLRWLSCRATSRADITATSRALSPVRLSRSLAFFTCCCPDFTAASWARFPVRLLRCPVFSPLPAPRSGALAFTHCSLPCGPVLAILPYQCGSRSGVTTAFSRGLWFLRHVAQSWTRVTGSR